MILPEANLIGTHVASSGGKSASAKSATRQSRVVLLGIEILSFIKEWRIFLDLCILARRAARVGPAVVVTYKYLCLFREMVNRVKCHAPFTWTWRWRRVKMLIKAAGENIARPRSLLWSKFIKAYWRAPKSAVTNSINENLLHYSAMIWRGFPASALTASSAWRSIQSANIEGPHRKMSTLSALYQANLISQN